MLLLIALPTLLLASAAQAPSPVPSPKADLAELAWIAGHWVGEDRKNGFSEEIWTAPRGDSMMGMWRWAPGDRVRLFEFLSIRLEEGHPVFRLRHYAPDGVGWEDKDKPLTLKLTRQGEREAAFEGPGPKGNLRIVYRRTPEGLVVTLEKEGEPLQEYRFREKPKP